MLPAAQIFDKIRFFAHDTSLEDSEIYNLLTLAHDEFNKSGYLFKWQKITETVPIFSGHSTGELSYDILRPVSISPELDVTFSGNNIILTSPATEDIEIEITYYFKLPAVLAEADLVVNDTMFYVFGGTAFACVYNNSPEAQYWLAKFKEHIKTMKEEEVFDINRVEVYPIISEIGGV